jgi:hypothetical protein
MWSLSDESLLAGLTSGGARSPPRRLCAASRLASTALRPRSAEDVAQQTLIRA